MKNKKNLWIAVVSMTVVLAILLTAAVTLTNQGKDPQPTTLQTQPNLDTDPTQQKTDPVTDPPTDPPTEPPVTKVATATIASVGDMLMHKPVFNACYNSETGEYELDILFRYIYNYFNDATLAVGNLETTLAGLDNGYEYSGYPSFNCPDSIIDAMKNTGFDVVLTANNHSYDTRSIGLRRTLEVIQQRELSYLGTKLNAEEKDYIVVDCNGIRIGLLCYTYEDGSGDPEKYAPNGITMTKEDSKLINCFNYNDLPTFYADVADNMAAMEEEGAEAVMIYMHWGVEYQLSANSKQKAIAQELCNLGVDVIVGGHPHVVQPTQLLTSEKDEDQKTLCIYSVGNAVSNQRLGLISSISTAHTEDGVLFNVTFAKYSDGTVIIESAQALPTWVNMCYDQDWNKRYYILPLDETVEDWKTAFDLTDSTLKQAEDSYERTIALVGAGMEESNAYYAAHQQEVEALLGVE